jgi:hypothetical protein
LLQVAVTSDEYGSFEVFKLDKQDIEQWNHDQDIEAVMDGTPYTPGFYWWACFPGCLPDGEASGPFATEDEAIADAQAV